MLCSPLRAASKCCSIREEKFFAFCAKMPQNTLQSPKSRTERNRERMKNYRLYLVRHGITAGNLQRRYVGGGTDLLKVDDALAAVDDFVAEKLK